VYEGYGFTGYYRDATTGFDYAQQRYYASSLGRFTTPDPYMPSAAIARPQSWNRYAYVENDPVNFVDPSGRRLLPAFDVGPSSDWIAVDDTWNRPDGGGGWRRDPCDPQADNYFITPGYCFVPAPVEPPPPPRPPAAPTCDDLLTLEVGGYLAIKGSPLASLAGQFVSDGRTYNVDPRFLVALSRAESTWGKDLTQKQGPNNAWSVSTHYYVGYPSLSAALSDVSKLLGTDYRYIRGGNVSAVGIYKVYNRTFDQTYFDDTIGADMKRLGSDLNDVEFPCP
jgi:RHS repeat-associated protein